MIPVRFCRCLQCIIDEQLSKLTNTLEDIKTLDTATSAVEERLCAVRASMRTQQKIQTHSWVRQGIIWLKIFVSQHNICLCVEFLAKTKQSSSNYITVTFQMSKKIFMLLSVILPSHHSIMYSFYPSIHHILCPS